MQGKENRLRLARLIIRLPNRRASASRAAAETVRFYEEHGGFAPTLPQLAMAMSCSWHTAQRRVADAKALGLLRSDVRGACPPSRAPQ